MNPAPPENARLAEAGPESRSKELPESVQKALAALRRYGPGSSRGELLPLDEFARKAIATPALARSLEDAFIKLLKGPLSAPAVEYICRQLALIGSERCFPAAASLLDEPKRGYAARIVFEALADRHAATRVLVERAIFGRGRCRLAAILSLGARRANCGAGAIAKALESGDPTIVNAALWALGRIGSASAARALSRQLFQNRNAPPASLLQASLECAQQLQQQGDTKDAELLQAQLQNLPFPEFIRKILEELSGQHGPLTETPKRRNP